MNFAYQKMFPGQLTVENLKMRKIYRHRFDFSYFTLCFCFQVGKGKGSREKKRGIWELGNYSYFNFRDSQLFFTFLDWK